MGVQKKKVSVLDSKADFICINLGGRGESADIAWLLKKKFPDVYRAYAGDISTHDFGSLHGHYMVCKVADTEKYIICLYSVVADVNGGVRIDPAAFRTALTAVVENVLIGWQPHFENPFSVAMEVPTTQQDTVLPIIKEVCASLSGGLSIYM